jgi:hypothetical protein
MVNRLSALTDRWIVPGACGMRRRDRIPHQLADDERKRNDLSRIHQAAIPHWPGKLDGSDKASKGLQREADFRNLFAAIAIAVLYAAGQKSVDLPDRVDAGRDAREPETYLRASLRQSALCHA